MLHDEFLYDKAWIPTRALHRLGKLPHICCLLLHWVLSSFVDPYERFVMLLKSRSRTHHPHMHYSYTGVGATTCFPSRSTQNCFTSTLGVNTKNMPYRISTKYMLQVLVAISQKFYYRKESWGYAKVIHKKRRDEKKNVGKCPRYLKQWVLRCPPEKKWDE